MAEIDYDWVNQQFDKTTLSDEVYNIVFDTLQSLDELSDSDQLAVADSLAALLRGHALVADPPNEIWADVQIGFVHGGDIVRVKHDAFSGELGKIHNGRRGKVQAARSGDVIFRSDDGQEPFLDGVHYSPYKLQKRVR